MRTTREESLRAAHRPGEGARVRRRSSNAWGGCGLRGFPPLTRGPHPTDSRRLQRTAPPASAPPPSSCVCPNAGSARCSGGPRRKHPLTSQAALRPSSPSRRGLRKRAGCSHLCVSGDDETASWARAWSGFARQTWVWTAPASSRSLGIAQRRLSCTRSRARHSV